MKVCPKCQSINGDAALCCTKCGALLGGSMHSGGSKIPQRPTPTQQSGPVPRPQTSQQQVNQMRKQSPQTTPPRGTSSVQQGYRPITHPSKRNGGNSVMKMVAIILGVVAIVGFAFFALSDLIRKKGKPLTAQQIETAYANGVVLIQNKYVYSADFGKLTVYFTGIDEDGDLENFSVDEDKAVTVTSYGTGFFVSDDGKIATNSHVACPMVDENIVRDNLSALKRFFSTTIAEQLSNINDEIHELTTVYYQLPSGSYQEQQVVKKINELKEKRSDLQATMDKFNNLNVTNLNLQAHSKIGVAYNNTFITSSTDFHDCVVIKDDAQHDVAVIQLKDKKTPTECPVIDVHNNNLELYDSDGELIDVDNIKLGTKLYMIGFNLGPSLALTSEGIKAQITDGKISQNTDETKMMYTIPALHGSSGSPILDEYGNFVGINFAGLDMTQNFNYGVKPKYLRTLLDK